MYMQPACPTYFARQFYFWLRFVLLFGSFCLARHLVGAWRWDGGGESATLVGNVVVDVGDDWARWASWLLVEGPAECYKYGQYDAGRNSP